MAKRVVLAYSGGLDTSVAVRWMIDQLGVEVIAVACDVGQGGDWEEIKARAKGAGAVEALVADCREEFAADYCMPVLKANALYENQYPLVSALSRPVIVKQLVAAAHGADAVAHGCTGKGNDQVRFEVATRALAPDLDIVAPVRSWGMTREDCIAYAAEHDIPLSASSSKNKIYSIDDNLWGRAIECGEMEDPWARPPEGVWLMTKPTATDRREVTVAFEQGVPVSVDGSDLPVYEIITQLNEIVGGYGWGRLDMVENRRVGIKSRETYEAPAALALIMAHRDLESICLERDLFHEKIGLEHRYAELVYDGLWFSPLKEALDAFVDSWQRYVTGEVRLRLEPGRCIVVGRRSPFSLYDYGLATYDAADSFHHADSEGFVKLWGLGIQTWSSRQATRDEAGGTGGG